MRRPKKIVLELPNAFDLGNDLGAIDLGSRAPTGECYVAVSIQTGEKGWASNDWVTQGTVVSKILIPAKTRYLRFFIEFPKYQEGREHGAVKKAEGGPAEEVPAGRR